MRVSELKKTMLFVLESAKGRNIISALDALAVAVQKNSQGPSYHSLSKQKQKTLAIIEDVSLAELTINETAILSNFIDPTLLGPSGVTHINEIFSEHKLDPMGAVYALEDLRQDFANLVETAEKILAVLRPLTSGRMDLDIEDGRAAIQIVFEKKAAVDTVTDMKDRLEEWWHIIRGASLLTHTAVEENKVLSVQKESPLCIEISSSYVVVHAIGLIINNVLLALERYRNLKNKVEEVHCLNLENKQIERDLDQEAQNFQRAIVKEFGAKVITELKSAKVVDGEIKNAMDLAVRNVFAFLDKGGSVDCRIPETNGSSEARQIQQLFAQIRLLKSNIDGGRLLAAAKRTA
jgi:regulator of replication initiation timing